MSREKWPEVNKANPCPICGKDHACKISPDGAVCMCLRIDRGAFKQSKGWYFHRLTESPRPGNGNGRPYRPAQAAKPTPERPAVDWKAEAQRLRAQATPELLAKLGESTGLPMTAWTALAPGFATAADLRRLRASGAGWDEAYPDGGFAFAEHDGAGRIVGLSFRALDGRKGCPAGAQRGLTVPANLSALPGAVLVVEGASDVAAAGAMNLPAVGRPSNRSGAMDLADALDGRQILVVGENDQKDGGAWPGRDGAKAVAQQIAARWGEPVKWALPPLGTKDVRSWLLAKIAAGLNIADPAAMKAAGLELLGALETGAKEAKAEKKSQADALVDLARDAELFHTPGGEDAYARIPQGDALDTVRLGSKAFRGWLSALYFRRVGKAPGAQALQDAIGVLIGRAMHEAPEAPIAVRIADHDGAIWLDLADAQRRAVRVTADGWQVVEAKDCPVRFVRPRGSLPLPVPTAGGSLEPLARLGNLRADNWPLALAWLLGTLRPIGPYPVLSVNGEQGAGKSTTSRMLRKLLDPNRAPVRAEPREARDLMIAARNGWLIAFDNLSHIAPWLSDALCRLSTGGGFSTRELYADSEECIFDSQRPTLLNGIEELTTRADLADRAITLSLPSIPEEQRRPEKELWAEYDAAWPGMLGALLQAAATAIRNLPQTRLAGLPRMADFCLWAVASEPALPVERGSFLAAYRANRQSSSDTAFEAAATGPALLALMEDREGWTGTAGELLADLAGHHADEATRRRPDWPKTPQGMSGQLRRLAPVLRQRGLLVTFFGRTGHQKRRMVRLEKLGAMEAASAATAATPENRPESGDECGLSAADVAPCPAAPREDRPQETPREMAPAAHAAHAADPTASYSGPVPTVAGGRVEVLL